MLRRELRNKNNKRYVRLDIKGGGCVENLNIIGLIADEEQRNDNRN